MRFVLRVLDLVFRGVMVCFFWAVKVIKPFVFSRVRGNLIFRCKIFVIYRLILGIKGYLCRHVIIKLNIMLNIALFGPPGAGKGTQAKKLVEKYNLAHLSTGDMIRKEIAEGTEFGKMAAGIINRGELLSDEFVVALIRNRIEHVTGVAGFLFDGFPRTVAQAEILDQMLTEMGNPLGALISIEVPHDELMRRMLERAKIEGRADDNEEVIEHRFKEYQEKTLPVAEYYKQQGKLHTVVGHGTVEEVFMALTGIIAKL